MLGPVRAVGRERSAGIGGHDDVDDPQARAQRPRRSDGRARGRPATRASRRSRRRWCAARRRARRSRAGRRGRGTARRGAFRRSRRRRARDRWRPRWAEPTTMRSASWAIAARCRARPGEPSATTNGRADTPARSTSASRVSTAAVVHGLLVLAVGAAADVVVEGEGVDGDEVAPGHAAARSARASASRPPSRPSTPTMMVLNMVCSSSCGGDRSCRAVPVARDEGRDQRLLVGIRAPGGRRGRSGRTCSAGRRGRARARRRRS